MQAIEAGIRWETRDRILLLTIDRPHCRNALDPAAHHQLAHLIDDFHSNDALLVAIITGTGDKTFCAGSDLANADSLDRRNLPPSGFGGLAERFDLEKPVIAAVNGDAVGGGLELVLACDLCIAVPAARFALPEPRVGQAASGGLHRLARHMPRKWMMELVLTGAMFNAEQAARMGIVNHIAAPGPNGPDVLAEALQMAQLICSNAPLSVHASKQMIDRGLAAPDLETAFAGQYPAYEKMLASDDAAEGRKAFLEKRAPHWQGK